MDVRVISWFYESQIYFEGYLWFMGVSYHVSLISFRSGGATIRRYNEAALMQVINFEKDFLTYLKVFKHLCLDSTLQSRVANLRCKTELRIMRWQFELRTQKIYFWVVARAFWRPIFQVFQFGTKNMCPRNLWVKKLMSLLLCLKYISVHQPFCAIEGTSEGHREPRNEVGPISPSEC